MSRFSVGTARTLEALRFLAAVFVLLAVAAGPSRAADPPEPRTWWIDLGVGAVDIHHSGPSAGASAANEAGGFFTLGFGHTVNGHLGLGLEIGASFLRSGGSGENGIVIIPALVTARVYPRERSPFHFRLGGGGVSWQDNNPAGTRAKGLAWEAGIGYDVRLTTYGYLTPFVLYQEGRPGSTTMRALLVGAAYGRW